MGTVASRADPLTGENVELRLMTRTGRLLEVEAKTQTLSLEGREVILGLFQDLSERQAAERDLREREAKYRALLNCQNDAVFLHHGQAAGAVIVEVNDIAMKRYGFTREEFLAMTPDDLVAPGPATDPGAGPAGGMSQQPQSAVFEVYHRRKTGAIFPVEINATTIELSDATYVLSVVRDISERRKIEQQRLSALQQLQRISSQIPGMVYQFERSLDGQYAITYASETIRKLFNLSAEAVKNNVSLLYERIHPENLAVFLESLRFSAANLAPWRCEFRARAEDDSYRWLHCNSLPQTDPDGKIVWHGFMNDVSYRKQAEAERRKLEEQLRQKCKIEAVGLLASGIAHNFNNNLSIIIGSLDLAKHRKLCCEEISALIDNAQTAASRASSLVGQIMTYSRQGSQKCEVVQLPRLLEETVSLIRSTIPATVNIQTSSACQGDGPAIQADPDRIQDALINLCTNAVHAMDEEGELSISLDTVELRENDIPVQFNCEPGWFVRIAVKDSGCGISAAVAEKIFDPFFTTKEVGQGTGMGLATVLATVQQFGGMIQVQSTLAVGTTFALCFPWHAASPGAAETKRPEARSGSERILFVDDDELLADLGQRILEELGYDVTAETNSLRALERVKRAPHDFDLVITDQTMPGLTGIELSRELHDLRADLPIVLCTGYSSKVSEDNARQFGIRLFCRKPLGMAELSQAVRIAFGKPS
jgi:PAS domain S-box-containing protein